MLNEEEIAKEFLNNLHKTVLEFEEGSGDRKLVEKYLRYLETLPVKKLLYVMRHGQ